MQALVLALAAVPAGASAAEGELRPADFDTGFTVTAGLFGGYVVRPPGLKDFRTPSNLNFAGLSGQEIRADHGIGLLGFDLRLAYTFRSGVFTPLVGVRAAYPLGSEYSLEVRDDAGTTGRLRLINEAYGEILLPGVGFRISGSDGRAGAALSPALLAYSTKGTLTQGTTTADVKATAYGLGADFDVFACLRFDRGSRWTSWVCPYGTVFAYTSTPSVFANGFIFGVRFDGTRHFF